MTQAAPIDFDPELAIKLVADSVQELRKADVFRVIEETMDGMRHQLSDYIIKHRPDLADEVREVMEEVHG